MPDASDLLDHAIRRAGLNPNSIAAATGGEVSATTVRTYLAGGKVTPSKVAALAKVIAAEAGVATATEVLRGYDLEDLALTIEERSLRQTPTTPTGSDPATMFGVGLDQVVAARQPPIPITAGPTLSAPSRHLLAAFTEWLQALEAGDLERR